MRAVLIDLDGVLYQGDQIVPGAAIAVSWLTDQAIPHLFVTNTTSRSRQDLVDKLEHLGIETTLDRILTPPVAARQWLTTHAPGPAALFIPKATQQDLSDLPVLPETAQTGAANVILGDLGEAWSFPVLNRAFRLLMAEWRLRWWHWA